MKNIFLMRLVNNSMVQRLLHRMMLLKLTTTGISLIKFQHLKSWEISTIQIT